MLFKKLLRTAWNYKTQFISMIIMISIGMGVFFGFNIEWYSLEKNVDDFIEETNYADYRIYNEQGFTEEDIEAIKKISKIDDASRVLSVNVDIKDSNDSLSLYVTEDYNVSIMKIIEGYEYDEGKDGFWLSSKYAAANDIKVGDTLTIKYAGTEVSGKVLGLAYSMEHMICVADENQLMPDAETFGFAYTTPGMIENALGMILYPQINIVSDMEKEDIENAISDAIGKTTLVVEKELHMPYMGALSEIEEGKTMGSILPVLFLAIAILTMVTTMHRIAANEKVQIGTLKALGFRDKKILGHYTSYGLFLGVAGGVVGIGLGFLIAWLVINENGMMGTYLDMPYWKLYMPGFCWIVFALTVALQTFISYLSVKKMLTGTATEALRPYAPKKMKAMKIEKTKLWRKFKFATKWNLRDVLRHKSRSAMTLVGVIGCMLLLVGGLGMKDTMGGFFELIDKEINNYVTKINIMENSDNEEVMKFAEKYEGDWQASTSIKIDDDAVTLDIYDVNNDMIRFVDENNNRVKLTDDGVYVCIRVGENYKIGDTLKFSPYGSDKEYEVKVAGVIRSVMTENITMTKEYAESIGISYNIGAVYTNVETAEIEDAEFISGKQSKKAIMDTYDQFMEIMNIMVAIFVVAAIVLGIVVLYNLGIMSYVERSRELATLKVVGFRDKHIGRILISQNVWLTLVGIIIGLPLGFLVLKVLIVALASEYELKLLVGPFTYIISLGVTMGVSMIVGLMVSAKNKDIDMVEALKGRE